MMDCREIAFRALEEAKELFSDADKIRTYEHYLEMITIIEEEE